MNSADLENRQRTSDALDEQRKAREAAAKLPALAARRERIATAMLATLASQCSLLESEDLSIFIRTAMKLTDALIAELDKDNEP